MITRNEKYNTMSHNVYSEDNKKTSTQLPNYLVIQEKNSINEKTHIHYFKSITEVINFVQKQKSICTVFEKAGSIGKFYQELITMSHGVV